MKTITLGLALFFGIVLTTTSCGNKAKIVKVNNTLITVGDSLKVLGEQWGHALSSDMTTTKDFSNLTPIRENMQAYISRKEQEAKALEDVGGSEKFKKAVLDYLAVEQQVAKSMQAFESINANTSQAELQKIGSDLQAISVKEPSAMAEVNKEQVLFAQKNNIQLIERK